MKRAPAGKLKFHILFAREGLSENWANALILSAYNHFLSLNT